MALTIGTAGVVEKKYNVYLTDLMATDSFDLDAAGITTLDLKDLTDFDDIVAWFKAQPAIERIDDSEASPALAWISDYKIFRGLLVQIGLTIADTNKIGTEDDGDIETSEIGKVILGKKGSVSSGILPSNVAAINELRELHGTEIGVIFESVNSGSINDFNTILAVSHITFNYQDEFKGNEPLKVIMELSKTINDADSFITYMDVAADLT